MVKIYFEETTHRDYSRTGYDDVFITYSLVPFGKSEEGHAENRVWYFVTLDETYTASEAASLARIAYAVAAPTEPAPTIVIFFCIIHLKNN